MTNEKALKALHDLVATCNDAAEGYAKAAKGVHDQELGDRLANISDERTRFGEDLTAALSRLGEQPRTDVHGGGILHAGWVDLEQSLRPKNDPEIVRECVAGDTGTLKHYDHALDQELPEEVRSTVQAQRTAVSRDIAYFGDKQARGSGA